MVRATRLISEDQKERYRTEGAVLLRGCLGADWIDRLRDGLDEVIADHGSMTSIAVSPDRGGRSLLDQFSSHRVPALADFIRHSPMARIAGEIAGVDVIQYVMDQSFCKAPGAIQRSPWHQDTPYMAFDGTDIVRTWICVDRSPGPITLSIVKGSHLWGQTFRATPPDAAGSREESAEAFTYSRTFDQSLPQLPEIDGHPEYTILNWDVEPGDVIAFDGRAVHGAGPANDYPHPRRAFAIVWAGPQVHYVRRPGNVIPDLSRMAGKQLDSGTPLLNHADVFPIVWRQTEPARAAR